MCTTCLTLQTNGYSQTKFILNAKAEEADVIIESLAAMVATGRITIQYIESVYPDSGLFEHLEDSYTNHVWDRLTDANPTASRVPDLRARSELLEKLSIPVVRDLAQKLLVNKLNVDLIFSE